LLVIDARAFIQYITNMLIVALLLTITQHRTK